MDEDTLTVWLDSALLMLGGFVLMTVLMMTVMNPPTKASEADGSTAPGNMIVEIQWPDKLDADVDLWVQGPGDVPVGYSNKSGRLFNLLRDDLGRPQDMTDSNYEIAYSRGAPAGEYTINIHMYRNPASFPVPVQVVVSAKDDNTTKALLTKKVELHKLNEELTVVRFKIDDHQEVVLGSVNSITKKLREAVSQ